MSKLVTTPSSIPQEPNVKFIKLVNKAPSSATANATTATGSNSTPLLEPVGGKITRRPGTGCIPVSGD